MLLILIPRIQDLIFMEIDRTALKKKVITLGVKPPIRGLQ